MGLEKDRVHRITVILAVIIFLMVVVTPVIVVLATRLRSGIMEARLTLQTRVTEARMENHQLKENEDNIESQ